MFLLHNATPREARSVWHICCLEKVQQKKDSVLKRLFINMPVLTVKHVAWRQLFVYFLGWVSDRVKGGFDSKYNTVWRTHTNTHTYT